MAKFMKIDMKTNADAIEEAYNFIRIGTEKKPYPSVDGLRVQLEMMAETETKAKTACPEQLVDLKIVEELDKSGFIDAV